MTRQGTETLDEAEMTAALRANLAGDDRALAGIVPIVSHLSVSTRQPLISDDVIARMRGAIETIALQMCKLTGQNQNAYPSSKVEAMLAGNGGLVNHCYALAVEGAITQRLANDHGIDPVLPALLQELIGSRDEDISRLSMALMASQASFMEAQRRGGISIFELPADIFDDALRILKKLAFEQGDESIALAETELRAQYNESSTRLGLLERLINAVGASAEIISEIDTAGLPIFISAIAHSTGQPRDLVALSCQRQQGLRLAIALKAAGRSIEAIARQLALLDNNLSLPLAFENWEQAKALALLEASPLGSVTGNGTVAKSG